MPRWAGRSSIRFILLRTESALSSEIEHLASGARAIAEAEFGERETGNAAQIVRNARTMEAAPALADDIDGRSIIAVQSSLLAILLAEFVRRITNVFPLLWMTSSLSRNGSTFLCSS